ncbi:putative membrane protein [Brucella grignonensis]|uniref:Putative membrane protein n=1 Tax=Brucella grignonensis TaxID=94627 RepID=A0A256FE72_9HYPH|nr:putative membrane protein [Brucella grignonensis]
MEETGQIGLSCAFILHVIATLWRITLSDKALLLGGTA